MTKNIQETKEKIIEAFEGIKEFEVSYVKEVYYSKTFKAKSKKELEDRFYNKELDFDNRIYVMINYISLLKIQVREFQRICKM